MYEGTKKTRIPSFETVRITKTALACKSQTGEEKSALPRSALPAFALLALSLVLVSSKRRSNEPASPQALGCRADGFAAFA